MNFKEELKKNYKYLIVLLIFLFIYVLIMLFFNNEKDDGYLIIGNSLIFQKRGDEWVQLNSVPDFDNQTFVLYDGNTKIENVKVQYNASKWYFFDEDYNELSIDNFRIAYTDELDIKLSENVLKKYEANDGRYISQVVGNVSEVALRNYENSLRKLEIDCDSDGDNEILYAISNYSYSVTDDKMMSYLFLVDNDKVKIVDKKEGINPFIMIESLDMNDDGKMEVIVANEVMDVPSFEKCFKIYGMKNDKFSMLKSCQYKI